ncbi:hypothetical protein Tco_1193573 [Tanacetum coccineum]
MLYKIPNNIDADKGVTLIDETQGRNDDNLIFDTCVLDEQEVEFEKVVSTAEVTTDSATITTVDELTLSQTLIEIKAAKPKVRGVMIQEPSEFTTTTTTTTPAASKPSQDKGKEKMIESKKYLKKKDQIIKKQENEDDKEKEDLKQRFEIIQDDEVAIDAIPLATKHAPIVNLQIHRKGMQGYYEIMRADRSAKTYLLFSQLLKEFDREDLENLRSNLKESTRKEIIALEAL